MKIGFILPAVLSLGNPYNGIREQALYQANALRSIGLDIRLLSPWDKDTVENLDLVHVYQGGPAGHGLEQILVKRNLPLVYSPIIDSMTPNWLYRISERLGTLCPSIETVQSYYSAQARFANIVAVRSTYEKQKLIKGLGIPENKIRIVLNGFDDDKPANTKQPTETEDTVRKKYSLCGDFIFHLSRYSNETKNVLNLVRAVGPMGLKLAIAGTTDSTPYCDQIHREAAKFSNVVFLGAISNEDRDALYSACHVFCLPSVREGTGLVALEAASKGAKIVITSNGGPPDYFGEHAIYVHGHSSEEISRAISESWESESSDDVRKYVLENLSWKNSAESILNIYREIIDV